MTRVLFVLLWVAVCFTMACTSSSSSTPISSGSNKYDSEYRIDSRPSSSNYGTGDEIGDRPLEDPPITVMVMSMETADVYPGDDYYVYAVVDNPDNRDLEYVWSVANGNISEVPESERGRLATLVEDEYRTASASPAPAAMPEEVPAGQPGAEPGVFSAQPGQQAPPATTNGNGQVVTAAPPNSGLPGTNTTGQTGETTTTVTSSGDIVSAGGGNYAETGSPELTAEQKAESEQKDNDLGGSTTSDEEIDPALQDLINQASEIKNELASGELPPEEYNTLEQKLQGIEDQIANWQSGVLEQRVVAGDEEVSSENVEALAEQLAQSVSSSRPEGGVVRPEPQGVTVAVESGSEESKSWIGDDAGTTAPGRAKGIRSEYSVWQDETEEPRKRILGGYGSLNESEALTEEESYGSYVYVTEEPYIMWTPSTPGPVNIYMMVRYKDEDLTEARILPVEVRLRDPEVKLSEEFPDILREDEYFYVALEASNIPAFYKGLFTVTFDPNRLSFRDAELGEFFDDTPQASLFYAEPDKMEGKVLLAIDSNRELTELGGEGVLVYAKFKAKQDINSRDETNIALVMDTTARYILDFNGENVLPLPVQRQAFRTDTIMPGDYPEYTREMTPGTEPGGQPVQNPQQQPATQTPQQTGSTYTPTSTPTYTPPSNTGTTYSGNTGTTYSNNTGNSGTANQGTDGSTNTGNENMNVNVTAERKHSSEEEEEAEGTGTGDKVATENGGGEAGTGEGDGSTTEEPTGETTETGEAAAEGDGETTDTEPETEPEPEPEPEPEGEAKG